ncbi:MAG: tetratricopeptide repeat protein [Planctomycetota bacterium]|jgi:tetratricopeptide (TPR) repeat protein
MAKRKRLNKRVVILLAAFGLLLVCAVIVWGLSRLPKDPVASARAGDKAFEAGKEALDKGDERTARAKFEQAIKHYAAAVAADKRETDYPYTLANVHWHMLRIADLSTREKSDHLRKANSNLDVALQRQPDHIPSMKLVCDIRWAGRKHAPLRYINAADALLKREDDHLNFFRRALAKTDMIASKPERYKAEAYADFGKAVDLDPHNILYWHFLLDFLEEHMREKFEDVCEEGIEKNPDVAALRVVYARYFLRRWDDVRTGRVPLEPGEEGKPAEWKEKAGKHLEIAIDREPEDTLSRIIMSDLHRMEGDLAGARKVLEEARALDEGDYRIHRSLAEIYARQHDHKEATIDEVIEAARKALATIPPLPSESSAGAQAEALRERLQTDRKGLNCTLANALTVKSATVTGSDKQELLKKAHERLSKVDPEFPGKAFIAARVAVAEGGGAEEAMEIIERAREIEAVDDRALDYLIALYLGPYSGRAEKLLKGMTETPSVLLYKAMLSIRYRRYGEASELAGRALAADKDNEDAKSVHQVASLLSGRVSQLPAEAKLTGRFSRLLLTALLEHAGRTWASGDRSQAVALLEDLHAKLPDNPDVVAGLFAFYQGLNQPAKAEELWKEIVAEHKDDEAWQRLVQMLTVAPEHRFAAEMERARSIQDPVDRELSMARTCFNYGKLGLFRQHLEVAANQKPDDPRVVRWRFELALAQEPADWKLAEECVNLAAKADLDSVGGRWYEARFLAARRQYPEAIAVLKEALKEHPLRKRERKLLGNCYLAVGRRDKAEEVYRKLAKDDPRDPEVAIKMARIMELTRKELEFVKWAETAYELAPIDPQVVKWHLALEERKARDDRLGGFIAAREEQLARAPDDLENILNLAVLYQRSKQNTKAEDYYRSYYYKSDQRLRALGVLGGFYVITKQYGKIGDLVDELRKKAGDDSTESNVYVAYGDLLSAYDRQQALNAYDRAIELDAENTRAYTAKARLLALEGKLGEAVELLAEYVKSHPDDTQTRKVLVRYHIDLMQLDTAAEELDRVLEAYAEDAEALRLRGVVALARNDNREALELFERALKVAPLYMEARLGRAEAYYFLREDKLAEEELKAAHELANSKERIVLLGAAWRRLGNPDRAEELFKSVLKYDPNYQPALRNLLSMYLAEGRSASLSEQLAKARRAFPQEPYYLVVQAAVHRQSIEPSREVAALEQALKLSPGSAPALWRYMDALIRAGRSEEALAVSEEYVDEPGHEVVLPAMRARAMAKLERAEDEVDALFVPAIKASNDNQLAMVISQLRGAYGDERAAEKLGAWVEHRPNDPQILLQLGLLRETIKDTNGAIEAYEKALKTTDLPRLRANIWSRIGVMHQTSDEVEKCEAAYLASLELDPDQAAAINNLAYLYADRLDNPTKALPYAKKAARMAPRSGLVLDTYGWVLARLEKYEQARAILEDAERLSTRGSSMIHYHLGYVYDGLGRLNEETEMLKMAKNQYRKAKALADKDKPIYKKISQALDDVTKVLETRSGP